MRCDRRWPDQRNLQPETVTEAAIPSIPEFSQQEPSEQERTMTTRSSDSGAHATARAPPPDPGAHDARATAEEDRVGETALRNPRVDPDLPVVELQCAKASLMVAPTHFRRTCSSDEAKDFLHDLKTLDDLEVRPCTLQWMQCTASVRATRCSSFEGPEC